LRTKIIYQGKLQVVKRKIYVETSVISYLTARPSKTIIGAAHQQLTLAWWEKRGQYELMVSEVVLRECGAGDSESAAKRLEVVRDLPLLLITEQAIKIAEDLIKQKIVPLKAIEDALHIAIATAHGVDYLVTWNCRHIANPEIQRGIASYLEQIGTVLPFICTPEELLGEENYE
jgi:predicted nucleic acid-binding protein